MGKQYFQLHSTLTSNFSQNPNSIPPQNPFKIEFRQFWSQRPRYPGIKAWRWRESCVYFGSYLFQSILGQGEWTWFVIQLKKVICKICARSTSFPCLNNKIEESIEFRNYGIDLLTPYFVDFYQQVAHKVVQIRKNFCGWKKFKKLEI